MTHFAKLDEAFLGNQGHRKASNSSSSSLRMKRRKSGGSPSSSEGRGMTGGWQSDYNENYRLEPDVPLNPQKEYGMYAKVPVEQEQPEPPSYYGSDCGQINDFCLSLINQVLQNDLCKRILRNILLEEYMDQLLKTKIDTLASNCTTVRKSYKDDEQQQQGGYGGWHLPQQQGGWTGSQSTSSLLDLLPSGEIWGLDLRTLSILGLLILGGLYFFDLYNRLFR